MATKKREKSAAQSMVNNLNSVTNNKYNADKAKFYLSKLKEKSGVNEQKLITELVLAGFKVNPIAKEFKDAIASEWEETCAQTLAEAAKK